MTGAADLELGLHRRDGRSWTVELRFSLPKGETDVRVVSNPSLHAAFDFATLQELAYDRDEYGRVLGENLFNAEGIGSAFKAARDAAAREGVSLRIRLFIGPSAPELQGLLWETIRHPAADAPLLMDEKVLFSRYLSSLDWRPVGVRPKTDLRAVVLVANAADVDSYRTEDRPLPPIDVEAELRRARRGLSPMRVTELVGEMCSLGALSDALRRGCDILYVVCHGYVAAGEPQLLLEDGAGNVERVPANDFVNRLRELQRCPRLVVLVSCRSAGTGVHSSGGEEGNLTSLGPQLAEAGVPAVVAMQGDVSMDTVATFAPHFFGELQRHGQIDQAMAVARAAIRHRPDWWAPTLFMRLRTGRLWYAPGFGRGFAKWPTLLNSIAEGRCTPILGPGVTDSFIGSHQQMAHRWAEMYHFPMAQHDRNDLPQVAQYLAVNQDSGFPREELRKFMATELVARYGRDLPEDLGGSGRDLPGRISSQALDEIFNAVAQVRRNEPELCEPHSALAELPLPLYVTTQPADLMEGALLAAGKQPRRELCRWKEDDEDLLWPTPVFDREPEYRPDEHRPLVFHLFGHLQCPPSIVLTEDDYFDFLIGTTANKDLVPAYVRQRLSATALLFLGFRVDEWDFRVVFRSMMNQEGRRRRASLTHVAVQIDPEEGGTLEPERARSYLDDYFRFENISIYWGSAEDFIQELGAQWRARQP